MQAQISSNESIGNAMAARWRQSAGRDNPAGPLFVAGEFAEADIVGDTMALTDNCGTACTVSNTGAHCPACC